MVPPDKIRCKTQISQLILTKSAMCASIKETGLLLVDYVIQRSPMSLLFYALSALVVSGASIHNECIENPPISKPNSGVGKVRQLGGLNAYVSGPIHRKRSVILISDVYGYETPHLRMIADKVAIAGFYSVVPDFFNGDPFVIGGNQTIWLTKHRPEEGYKLAGPLVDALKHKGITKFGAVVFCWGGKVAVDLLNNNANIQVGVLVHPTYTNADDIKKVRVPISILGGENDRTASPTLLKQYEDILKANVVENFVKVYPNVRHGWTLRYNDTDLQAVRSADEAHADMLNWFIKHLK